VEKPFLSLDAAFAPRSSQTSAAPTLDASLRASRTRPVAGHWRVLTLKARWTAADGTRHTHAVTVGFDPRAIPDRSLNHLLVATGEQPAYFPRLFHWGRRLLWWLSGWRGPEQRPSSRIAIHERHHFGPDAADLAAAAAPVVDDRFTLIGPAQDGQHVDLSAVRHKGIAHGDAPANRHFHLTFFRPGGDDWSPALATHENNRVVRDNPARWPQPGGVVDLAPSILIDSAVLGLIRNLHGTSSRLVSGQTRMAKLLQDRFGSLANEFDPAFRP
jgi:hypothetical protein